MTTTEGGPRHAGAELVPRLAFAGVGWIGRHRMEAVLGACRAEVVAVADPDPASRAEAARLAPRAHLCERLDELLAAGVDGGVDGVVIATPSALHADQTLAALERGLAVYCQKPLGRTGAESRRVVEAAARSDRLLGVDYCYRYTAAARCLRELVASGQLGDVYAATLEFHNAYGPDKPWFYDPALSGGGCVIDLGSHLIDLALWLLGTPAVLAVDADLYWGGRPAPPPGGGVEDFAAVRLGLAGGATVRLACSWNLPAGRDAVIEARLYGTRGGAALRNVGGSFYDFVAERYVGTRCETLVEPPDAWGGRGIVAWTRRLATNRTFDPRARRWVMVSEVIDRVYAAGCAAEGRTS